MVSETTSMIRHRKLLGLQGVPKGETVVREMARISSVELYFTALRCIFTIWHFKQTTSWTTLSTLAWTRSRHFKFSECKKLLGHSGGQVHRRSAQLLIRTRGEAPGNRGNGELEVQSLLIQMFFSVIEST